MALLPVTLCHMLEQNMQNADSKFLLENVIIWIYFHGSNFVESLDLGNDCWKIIPGGWLKDIPWNFRLMMLDLFKVAEKKYLMSQTKMDRKYKKACKREKPLSIKNWD